MWHVFIHEPTFDDWVHDKQKTSSSLGTAGHGSTTTTTVPAVKGMLIFWNQSTTYASVVVDDRAVHSNPAISKVTTFSSSLGYSYRVIVRRPEVCVISISQMIVYPFDKSYFCLSQTLKPLPIGCRKAAGSKFASVSGPLPSRSRWTEASGRQNICLSVRPGKNLPALPIDVMQTAYWLRLARARHAF